jgi:AbrB family looped-hinge helix DNA binding protein
MDERLVVLTRKGQITIPAEMRKVLGLREGDKVAVVLESGQVRLSRAGSVVARTAGILKPTEPPVTAKELREAAEQAIAEDVAERMGA